MRTLLGAFLWTLFLFLVLLLHRREEKRRLAEYRGLCRLVFHVKDALARAPEPLPLVYARFEDDALSHAGFLSFLREKGLFHALSCGVLHLDEEDLSPFMSYAHGLGNRLYTDEKAAVAALSSEAAAHLSQREAALPRKERLTGTLFFSGGMLILLLLL